MFRHFLVAIVLAATSVVRANTLITWVAITPPFFNLHIVCPAGFKTTARSVWVCSSRPSPAQTMESTTAVRLSLLLYVSTNGQALQVTHPSLSTLDSLPPLRFLPAGQEESVTVSIITIATKIFWLMLSAIVVPPFVSLSLSLRY